MNAMGHPRCPNCYHTMCELFDVREVTPLCAAAIPNGRYQCYHCTPLREDREAPLKIERIPPTAPVESVEVVSDRLVIRREVVPVTDLMAALKRSAPTPGHLAYLEDCRRRPTYDNAQERKRWVDLNDVCRDSWERKPTAREWPLPHDFMDWREL